MIVNLSEQCPLGLVQQRTSRVEEDLNEDEREFLWLVRVGDVEGLKSLLQANTNLNFNCCDYRGQRALDIAVGCHDLDILDCLLSECRANPVHFYCAVLRAVFENDSNILELLLDRAEEDPKLQEKLNILMNGGSDCKDCPPEVPCSNLTPTMAAAIGGNLEITRILLERGHCIQKPHSTKCRCQENCLKQTNVGETLTQSISRMNAFKALASPSYLIMTSEDPILSAFQLSKEMNDLSEEFPENQKEYKDLAKQCSTFAAEVLNECRNTQEVQTVLVQKKGFNDPRPHRFSRLHLAVQCGQKEFVTHASCQQVLRSMWVESIGSWYSWSFKRRVMHVLKHAFLTPIVSLAFIFIPKAELLGPLRVPLNRFIYSATSYIVFLSLLMVTLLNDRRYDMESPISWTEMVVCCFVIGHSWEIITNLFSKGFKSYFQSFWSSFDLVMFCLFLVTDMLWFSVVVFNVLTGTDIASNRMSWPWYHPVLIGEGLYATASVMAFSRLLIWCHVHSRLGPLGTSIKYMLGDVARFFILFFIVMFAFSTGINSIYKNYKDSSRMDDSNELIEQPDAFLTLKNTFKSLFWAIFGMGEPDFAQIVVSNNYSGIANDSNDESNEHFFTEGVGYGLWGLYHMVTVIVLLNMLIAMMADSYQRVQLNADLEWKFACSSLWLSVFDSHSIVPVPFNLIPSMHRVTLMVKWLVSKFKGSSNSHGGKVSCSKTRCCYWETEHDHVSRRIEEDKYQRLVVQLIRRYLHCKELKESASKGVTTITSEFREKLKSEIIQEMSRSAKVPNRTFTRRNRRTTRRPQPATVINESFPQ